MRPSPMGGRRSGRPGERRAGPEREFEKRKEVGPAERLAWLLPHRTTRGARSPPGPAMAPWRKTDKERHGVGRCGHGVPSWGKGSWPENRTQKDAAGGGGMGAGRER